MSLDRLELLEVRLGSGKVYLVRPLSSKERPAPGLCSLCGLFAVILGKPATTGLGILFKGFI